MAGVDVPDWMEGRALPVSEEDAAAQGREHVFTQYESYTYDAQIKMNAVYADGWICNVYERTETYAGTEGELYNVEEDPRQRNNLWDDPAAASMKSRLLKQAFDASVFTMDPSPPRLGAF